MEFQGHFDTLLQPGLVGDNGVGGVIVWLMINVGYILWLNFNGIEDGVILNCDGFSIVPGFDKYFSLLIFLNLFCFKVINRRWYYNY